MQKNIQEADKTKEFPYGSGIPSLWKELVGKCHCEKCLQEDYDERIKNGTPFEDLVFKHPVWLMILCQKCGNKRCPHATDHNNECTNSNEAGQKGSSYEHCIVPPKEEDEKPV